MDSVRRLSMSVAGKIRKFEKHSRSEKLTHDRLNNDVESNCKTKKCINIRKFLQRIVKVFGNFFKTSKFAGLPLSIVYGVFLYLYITYMILPGPESMNAHTSERKVSQKTWACRLTGNTSTLYNQIMSGNMSLSPISSIGDNPDVNTTMEANDKTSNFNSNIGVGVSSGFTLLLGTTSVFSRHTRCTMMLILPAIITGRGRAFVMTIIMGLLIEGPINSINYNVNRVVESSSCMYKSMKSMACLFTVEIQRMMSLMVAIVKEQQTKMLEDLEDIKKRLNTYADKASKELRERQTELNRNLAKLSSDMETLRSFLESVNKPCQHTESAIGSVSNFFDDVYDEISSWFSKKKRRRRDISLCGKSTPFPAVTIDPDIDTVTLEELNRWVEDLVPEVDLTNVGIPDIRPLVNAPSVEDIREKILSTVSNLFNIIREYLTVVKKCFLLVSLLLLAIDSVRYLQSYYSDDSFDNKFIDNNIRALWRHHGYEKLTPLRHWELNTKYQVSASPKISKDEFKRILMSAFPIIVVSLVAVCVILSDYALAKLLATLTVNGKFALSFEGMDQGVTLQQLFTKYKVFENNTTVNMDLLNLQKIDISTDPCLPKPVFTSSRRIVIIVVLLVLMALSCFFDAYATRLRARICNVFYYDRAAERGEYLHKNISLGRKTRRFNFQMILTKELRRRERARQFSWLCRLPRLFGSSRTNAKIPCPGCLWKVNIDDTKTVLLNDYKKNVQCKICNDCYKDF